MALPSLIGGRPSRYPVTNPYKSQLPGMMGGQSTRYPPPRSFAPYIQNKPPVNDGWQNQQPNQPPAVPPGTSTGANPYDYSGDPILQQQLGLNQKMLGEAAASRTEAQKKLLLGFGSSELARKLFGGEQAFIDSVGGNPFSVLGQIRHSYEGRGGQINQANEGLNKQNLFYSSERTANVLPELYRARQGQEYDATQNVQNALDQISQAYMGVQNQTAQSAIAAQQDAARRAIDAALKNGYGPGASDTEPTPAVGASGTNPGATSAQAGTPYNILPGANPIMYFK